MKEHAPTQRSGNPAAEVSQADFQRVRDLLAKAASPIRGGDQRSRFLDVLAEINAFSDRHPDARLDEVSAIRQITMRALEID